MRALYMADPASCRPDCETAIGRLEHALLRLPADFTLHHRLGVCYGGGCRRHSLVNPRIAEAFLRQAVRLSGGHAGPSRAAVLEEMGNFLLHGAAIEPVAALREAIECHQAAARICQGLGKAGDRARLEFNLGNSCCELSELTGEDHWREAVAHYQTSLEIRTRQADPERHAAVLKNLGTAYRRLTAGDPAVNIGKAIECYRRALWFYLPAAYPAQNAGLHCNLGNAFLSLPERGAETPGRNARRALRHFDRALRIQWRLQAGRAYGITQWNRAQAYFQLAGTAPSVNLPLAVGCLEDAHAVFASCGEECYTHLIEEQLEWIIRPRAGRTGAGSPSPVPPQPLSVPSGAK